MVEQLLKDRILAVKKEFDKEFRLWAVTRQIFEISHYSIYEERSIIDEDYVKIGYSHIIERYFFTKQKGTKYYDHIGLGSYYGKGLAFGEIKYIMNNLIKREREVIYIEEIEIYNKLNDLIKNFKMADLVILTNPVNISKFVDMDNFILKNEGTLWGYYRDIPLYWTSELPKNEYYLFNKNIGILNILKDADIKITEINKSEYESIIRDIPKLTKEELKNQIRVNANEVIKFILTEKKDNIIKIIKCKPLQQI